MKPRLLIVNVNWLGDVLFSTPAIRALRKHQPSATIACLVPSRCAPVLRNNPYLNEVIPYEDRRSMTAWPEYGRVIGELRKRHFDRAIFFHRSKTKVFLAALAGIQERIGYSALSRDRFLTRTYEAPLEKIHRIDYFLNLLENMGIPPDGRTLDFFPERGAEASLERLLQCRGVPQGASYVVVHPGGNWALKQWPADYFVEWIRLFLNRFPYRVVLCGTKREKGLSRQIESHFCEKEVISLCGETSLDVLAMLLRKARFLLSNDSGPVHLAASQETPILALFGPTSPGITGPVSKNRMILLRKDVGCEIPCYFRSCNYRVCMEWLKPQEVFEKTLELLTP